jgi:NAD(P)H dehydrogenase (quinone)
MSSSDASKNVLITGATGKTGNAAVRYSLERGLNVRAMVHGIDERSQALADLGAEIVVGDLLDINTIGPAIEGTDAGYFVYPIRPGLIYATVNFAQAAKETGGNVILNLSQRSANRESASNSVRDTYISEQVFNWSGVDVIHLRPTMFLEWFLYPWMLPNIRKGRLWIAAGEGTCSIVGTEDQGRAVAALLRNPEGHIGTTIPLSGPAELGQAQMAAELSEALGREIVYENPSVDEFADYMAEIGMHPYLVQHVRGLMPDYQEGRLGGADDNIEKLTGTRPMSVGEFARANAHILNGAK